MPGLPLQLWRLLRVRALARQTLQRLRPLRRRLRGGDPRHHCRRPLDGQVQTDKSGHESSANGLWSHIDIVIDLFGELGPNLIFVRGSMKFDSAVARLVCPDMLGSF